MASDDQSNPYQQPSHWPRMPTGTMRLGPLPKASPRAPEPAPLPPRVGPESEPVATAPLRPQILRGPASILTGGGAAPLATRPVLAEALIRAPDPKPEPEPERPLHLDREPARMAPQPGDLNLDIPTREPDPLAAPIAGGWTPPRARKSSPLVPVAGAVVVGLAGVGILAFVMTAGQRAAPPAPVAVAAAPAAPVQDAPLQDGGTSATPAPAAKAAALRTTPIEAAPLPPAPVAAPTRPAAQRLAARAVRKPAPPSSAADAEPLPVPDPPDPEVAGPRITIPMPEPEPAPPPAPVIRPPPPGPDQPMATRNPD